jgi:superfamily II DNA or RNA helicase
MSAAVFVLAADLFFGSRYGLTATPKREDGLEDIYFSHVGPIFYSDLQGELSSKIYFKKLPTVLTKSEKPRIVDITGEFSVGKFYQVLSEKVSRNNGILGVVGQALSKGRKVLVLVHAAKHPEILLEKFSSSKLGKDYTAAAVSGKTKGEERTRLMEGADVTFATFGVAREGLDVASLDTLVFATPFKAWGAFQQGKGRIERIVSSKKEPLVIVIDDHKLGPSAAMCNKLRRSIRLKGFSYKDVS